MKFLKWLVLSIFVWLVVVSLSNRALAGPRAPLGYALVIGSNAEGPGQAPLRYAEQDAQRVADVLVDLGGYEQERVERLVRPTVAALSLALERIRERLEAHAAAGEQAQFFFYYSGHARADALNLGAQSFPLETLRQRILQLPSTLSIVVLDACQSGAFSRVKGASPAADFSFNSVERLNTRGVAVMASSSGQELSQESDQLKSGYFTHYLLVALRGGGDENRDGRVTLAEAYRYAYDRTLAATLATSVGEQHVTLETELRGKGEVAITYPAQARARLILSREVTGKAFVRHVESGAVLAELEKAAGAPVELALPAGRYAVDLRQGERVSRCALELEDGAPRTLEPSLCEPLSSSADRVKGEPVDGERTEREGWLLEVGVGFGGSEGQSEYLSRLAVFGFEREATVVGRYSFAAGYRVFDDVAVGLSFFNLAAARFRRGADIPQDYQFHGLALGPWLEGQLDLGADIALFGRLGAGAVWASSSFDAIEPYPALADAEPSIQLDPVSTEVVSRDQLGPYGALEVGFAFMPWRHVGMVIQSRYAYAPALRNELDDVHDLGGLTVLVGLRARTWE